VRRFAPEGDKDGRKKHWLKHVYTKRRGDAAVQDWWRKRLVCGV
jgi:hypothetical protein